MAAVPRARVLLVVVSLLALAVAVAVSSLLQDGDSETATARSGESTAGSDRLQGPDVPPGGVLPGRLWAIVPASRSRASNCRLRAIDLGALELEPPAELEHCTLIDVSPDGRYAVAVDQGLDLALFDLAERPEKLFDLEPIFQERSARSTRIAAVSTDGQVAWCSAANETTVLSLADGTRRRAVGCDPRFGPGGELFTRTLPPLADAVRRDGESILTSDHFRQGLDLDADGPSTLLAYDVGVEGLIATKVRRVLGFPQPTVQLWEGGSPPSFHRISGLRPPLEASGLELSPDATRVALGWPGLLAGVLDFGFERLSRTLKQGSYAWSPDGRWLAIGDPRVVSIYARGSDAPSYVLPVATWMIAWTD